MDSEVLVKEVLKDGRGKGEEGSKDEAAVRAEMIPEVSLEKEVEGGGSKGEDQSNGEASGDAEMNSEVSAEVETENGGSKGKEESEAEEEDGESGEATSSSEEEEEDDDEEGEESSEASSSSDEEEQRANNHCGVGDMAALIEEGKLMVGINDDDDDDDDEDEEEEEASQGHVNSKHEAEILPPVPKIEVQLEPHHKALPVGTISSIMGERVIVEGSAQHNPLNEGSILWRTESRTPLGIVEELFGPVKNPYYLVRYNSVEEVPSGISAGTAVSFVMEFANHILNVKELYTKGYDGSGDNIEDQTDDPEFSDDEKEAEYKRSLRLAKGQTDRQLDSKKHSGDKKRKQPKDAGFHKGIPRTHDVATPAHQSKHRIYRSDMAPVADNSGRSRTSVPIMTPPVTLNPAMASAIQFADQIGGCFPNPSHQFLPQQPNVVWPGGFPPSMYPNMGINGAALAANIMQNILSGSNQYRQHYQNQNFGGFLNGIPMIPTQFIPQSGMPVNPMPFGGPQVNPPFGPTSELGMGQGNFGNLGYLAGDQGLPHPGLPNAQGYGRLPSSHGGGGQRPMQFNSGQFNQGSSSLSGRRPQQQGGQHSQGRGSGGHH
uniref:H/ACA ribonucleoprotein complex non-core subunit NAF1 n=2 Tax=Triticum urartu TaxID=4572 RepID=A0A8R7UU24_TRIUA